MKNEKLIKKYDKHANMYEKNRSNPTLARWRSRIIKNANGRVLEVGVGVTFTQNFYKKTSTNYVSNQTRLIVSSPRFHYVAIQNQW